MNSNSSRWPFFYGWTIVAVAFLSMGVWLAMRGTFSVFLVVLLDEFHWTRAAAAGVQSVSFIVYTFSAPLAGTLIDRFGPRRVMLPGILVLCVGLFLSAHVKSLTQFYIFYGVIVAFGVTFISLVAYSAVLSHWFERKRGLAGGIAVSGMGIGNFVLVPLTQYMIDVAGWRFAFMILAGLVFVLLFPLTAFLVRHKPAEMGLRPDNAGRTDGGAEPRRGRIRVVDNRWAETNWTLPLVAREGRFWAVLAYSFLVIIPIYLILIHGPRLLVDKGFSGMDAAFVVAALGITSSVFKVFWGWLSDRIGRELAFTIGSFILALGVFILLLLEAGGPPQLIYLFIGFFGCGWGIAAPIFFAIAADLFQGKAFGLIYGMNEAIIGLGSALGPWVGGMSFDTTGSYKTALLLGIAAALASCPFVWLAAPRKVRRVIRNPASSVPL